MVNRTKKAIVDGFNRLIKENDFQKISVDMIMKVSGVSRSTFYRHFHDKYEVMNETYKNLLDYYADPANSSNYRDLCYHLFSYAQDNLKIFKNVLDSKGFNSFSNFIYEYSYEKALAITKANRNGEGFTPVEELQVDIFCHGIYAVYQKIIRRKYDVNPSDAADALYEMMPASLKYYWW